MDGLDLGEIDEAERLLVAALRVDRGIVVQLEAIEIEPAFLEAIGTEATLAHLLKVALHGRERERAEQADQHQQRHQATTRSKEIECTTKRKRKVAWRKSSVFRFDFVVVVVSLPHIINTHTQTRYLTP